MTSDVWQAHTPADPSETHRLERCGHAENAPLAAFVLLAAAVAAQEPQPLTNEDIVGLVQAGLSPAVIAAKIATSQCALSPERVACLASDLARVLPHAGSSILQSRGHVYGIRNLIDVWPPALTVAQDAALGAAVGSVLGKGFGLVRSIFFDKPPGRTWSLPWHRDLTIAVWEVKRADGEFQRPTVKAGVPHVEAPAWLLQTMLTVRVALDDVGDDNGPLLVIPGSHVDDRDHMPSEQDLATRTQALHMRAGDALFIRPLVLHRSGPSKTGTGRHRRTLHFEFAVALALPGGLEWHRFLRTS